MKGIYKLIDSIGNLILLNAMFLLTTIGTFGIGFGSSISALFASLLDLKTDDSGYYIRNYFKNFKRNFLVATKVWFIILALLVAAYLNLLMIQTITSPELKVVLVVFVGGFLIELFFATVYVFIIITKFEVKTIKSFLLSLFYAHKYIHYTLLFVVLWYLSMAAPIYISFAFIFIIFALVAKVQTLLLKDIWRKLYTNEKISEF